jgi:hypothetical protein
MAFKTFLASFGVPCLSLAVAVAFGIQNGNDRLLTDRIEAKVAELKIKGTLQCVLDLPRSVSKTKIKNCWLK